MAEFDPSKPFDVVSPAAGPPEFDPSRPFEAPEPGHSAARDQIAAAMRLGAGAAGPIGGALIHGAAAVVENPEPKIRGAIQGATIGLGDELRGAIAASPEVMARGPQGIPDAISAFVARKLAGDHARDAIYERERDDERARNAEARAADPIGYGVSEAVGGALPAVVSPLSGGASVVGRLAAAGGNAALQGALQGAGHSEATSASGVAKDAAELAAISGLFGTALAGVGEGLSGGLKKLASMAPGRAVKSLGPTAPEIRKLADLPGGAKGVGEQLLAEGIPIASKRGVAEWAAEKLAEKEAAFDSIIAATDEKLGPVVDVEGVVRRGKVLAGELRETLGGKEAAAKLDGILSDVRSIASKDAPGVPPGFEVSPDGMGLVASTGEKAETPLVPMSVAHRFERELGDLAYSEERERAGPLAEKLRQLRNHMSEAVDGAAEKAGLGEDWTGANKEWRIFHSVAKVAEGGASREEARNFLGISDKFGAVGAAGIAALGHPVAALYTLGGIGAHVLWNRYGNQAASKLINLLAENPAALEAYAVPLERAMAKGPAVGLAKHLKLMESEPAYPAIASRAGVPEFRPSEVDLGDPAAIAQAHVADKGLGAVLRGGAAPVASSLAVLGGLAQSHQAVAERIQSESGAVVNGAKATEPAAKTIAAARASFERRSEEVLRLAHDPKALTSTIQSATAGLHDHAPTVGMHVGATSTRAVQFLAAKLPQHPPAGLMTHKWVPSATEMAIWNRYYDAVEDPVGVMKQAATGLLSKEAVEAVKAVYPDLYESMRKAVSVRLTTPSGKPRMSLPYRQRLAVSQFIGSDVTGSMSPEAIQASQRVYQSSLRPSIQPPPPSKAGALTLGERSMTATERIANRE